MSSSIYQLQPSASSSGLWALTARKFAPIESDKALLFGISLKNQLAEAAGDCDEDFLAPTAYAKELLLDNLTNLFEIGGRLAEYVLAPDGSGGLVVTWRRGQKHVRLFFPAQVAGQFYLYYEEPGRFDSVSNPGLEVIREQLNWLNL
jgi:hypothetical protein